MSAIIIEAKNIEFKGGTIQEIEIEWILECPDEIIVELLKKEPYRIKIRDYLSSSKNNTTEQKRLITLL